jgi:hypothetical protein
VILLPVSVYSFGSTPPASQKQAPTRHQSEHLHPDPPAVNLLSHPYPVPTSIASPQTRTYTQRDLGQQQEVRDRLSGKSGPRESSLIEVYREKEQQSDSSGGSEPRENSTCTPSQWQPPHCPRAWRTRDAATPTTSAPRPDTFLSSLPWDGARRRATGTEKIMGSRRTLILTMVGTIRIGMFMVRRYTTRLRKRKNNGSSARRTLQVRCMSSCHPSNCKFSKLPAPSACFFFFTRMYHIFRST